MASQEAAESSPPDAKKRKLSSIFSNSLLTNAPIFDKLENVTFIVGNNETGIEHIGGNRTIFAVHSDVFQAQLFGSMVESNQDEIKIEDITPQAFKFLKNLFYVKDQQLSVDIVLDVLYASKKYLLIDLECECYKFIENIKNVNDWWKLISKQTITTDIDMDDALIRKSQILIKNSHTIVKHDEKLSQLTPEWLAKLVQSSSFVVDDESLVWEMCVKYCQGKAETADIGQVIASNSEEKSESNKTSMVVKMMNEYFVKHIRFAIMDQNYFFSKIEKSGILDGLTMYDICKCCFLNNAETRSNRYNGTYCWYPRKAYCQYFLARYDIRLLSKGDKILVEYMDGRYESKTIGNFDWKSPRRNSSGKNGIKFTEFKENYFKNQTIDSMRSEHNFGSIQDNCDLVPSNGDVKKFFRTGDFVEFRNCSTDEWLTGKICGLPRKEKSHIKWWEAMIEVKQINEGSKCKRMRLHPWNFTCLRPL